MNPTCDVYTEYPDNLECSSERYFISSLNLGQNYSTKILLLKRLGISNEYLIEWFSKKICFVHFQFYVPKFKVSPDCFVCQRSRATDFDFVSPTNQDFYRKIYPKCVIGSGICFDCITYLKTHPVKFNAELYEGPVWATLDESRIVNSQVPSLKLLCRGIKSYRPLSKASPLTIKDALEIRHTFSNVSSFCKEDYADIFIYLNIIKNLNEFKSTSEVCHKIWHQLKGPKALYFESLYLSDLKYIPEGMKHSIPYIIYTKNNSNLESMCLLCQDLNCLGCFKSLSLISYGSSSTLHNHFLESTCRCCKKKIVSSSQYHRHEKSQIFCGSSSCKLNYSKIIKNLWKIDVLSESSDVFPHVICSSCKSLFTTPYSHTLLPIADFKPHKNNNCDCKLELFYANANVNSCLDKLEVLVSFSKVPSLKYLSYVYSPDGKLSVKMALEIYNTLEFNRKTVDSNECFKKLSASSVILFPLKSIFRTKCKKFQEILGTLSENFGIYSLELRKGLKKKLNVLLSFEYYYCEPSIKQSKKVVKFNLEGYIHVLCYSCPDYACVGSCTKPSMPKESNGTKSQYVLISKRLGLDRPLSRPEYARYKLTQKFIPDSEFEAHCLNCDDEFCDGKSCSRSTTLQRRSRLKKKLNLSKLPSVRDVLYYSIAGELPLTERPPRPKKKFVFTQCPQCLKEFSKESFYWKHLKKCTPGFQCFICYDIFKSKLLLENHNCSFFANFSEVKKGLLRAGSWKVKRDNSRLIISRFSDGLSVVLKPSDDSRVVVSGKGTLEFKKEIISKNYKRKKQNLSLKRQKISEEEILNDSYKSICKLGNYICPLCGVHFRLNQPYGNHVKKRLCSSIYKNKWLFLPEYAYISLNINLDIRMAINISFDNVPSLKILCRKIKNNPWTISIKEGLELFFSLKNTNQSHWKTSRILPHYGSVQSFIEECYPIEETLFHLENKLLSSQKQSVRLLWIDKLLKFLLLPFSDLFDARKISKYKVYEYPTTAEQVKIFCWNCPLEDCTGCLEYSEDISYKIEDDRTTRFREMNFYGIGVGRVSAIFETWAPKLKRPNGTEKSTTNYYDTQN